jgi:hypothetical protein
MAISSQSLTHESSQRSLVLEIADVCFEMFSTKELRRPELILHEIALSFPLATTQNIREAVSLAHSWRVSLRALSGLIH